MNIRFIILRSAFVLLGFFWVMQVCSHPGGHYGGAEPQHFRRWTLLSGKEIAAHFLMSRGARIYLENQQGLAYFDLKEFSPADRAWLTQKISGLRQKNQTLQRLSEPVNRSNIPAMGMALLLMLALLTGLHQIALYIKISRPLAGMACCSLLVLLGAGAVLIACRKSKPVQPDNSVVSLPKTSIGFLDSAFDVYKPLIATQWDNNYYYISGNGLPNHNMMVGITSWQQQVPIPQAYTGSNSWSIPLQPVYAQVPLSTRTNFMKGAVAIAINGIPIFNALNNRGEDSYQIGELDQWGGHCGRADDYHYHAAPMHLRSANALLPIAIGLDGFAVYGSLEPDGTNMNALDTCHGHSWKYGGYHYHGTSTYPYVIGAMKGKVNLDPATPAPENQILPQAFAKGARPALTPLKGATITDFRSPGSNAYLLTYQISGKTGSVYYTWTNGGLFTYTLTDTAGRSVTNSYQR